MRITSRRRAIIFFISLCACLAAVAVAVGFGWIILNWREGIRVFLGIIFFGAIVAGLILNTTFLVREIRRNEQHDSFINAVTHELKTPIASIRLYLQTLERRDVEESQRKDFYRLMLDDTDRLMGTVEQVLKAGTATVKKSRRAPLDFGKLVRDCVEIARIGYHLQPDALEYEDVQGDGAQVNGDSEELRTAVSNVIDNAIKYSGEKVAVSVRVEVPDEKHVRLSVRDEGVGVPSEELKRIFKRFYRVPHRSLSSCKGHRLGFVHCPHDRQKTRRKSLRGESRGRSRDNRNFATASERDMSHVLIVEDEVHIANGLRFNLEAEGHAVEVVGDGESALELLLGVPLETKQKGEALRTQPVNFDAMVLDVMLPGKDGFAVATELRAAKNFIPVLMLTARGRPEDVLKGFASGADDYLPKPFELPILLARLQGLLRRRDWMNLSAQPAVSSVAIQGQGESPPAAEYDVFAFQGRTIDFGKLELRVNGTTIRLTLMEAELLRHLIRNSGRIVSRKSILEEVWGLHEDTDTRAIDNFIVRLRRYIEENPSKPRHLLTVRGVGYKFLPEPEVA